MQYWQRIMGQAHGTRRGGHFMVSRTFLEFVVGVILLLKGLRGCLHLPSVLATAHWGSVWSAGHLAITLIGTLATLVGGGLLVAHAWRRMRKATRHTTTA